MDDESLASVEAEGHNPKLARPFMETQSLVFGQCISCSGSMQAAGSCVVCTNEAVKDCVLPRLVRAIADVKNPARYELSQIATPLWIEQHRAQEVPLPTDKPKKVKETDNGS